MEHMETSRRGFHVGASDKADGLSTCLSTSYTGIIAFMAVATESSFSKAADRLGMGRSSISRCVQKLEMQLDTRLFQRTTRSTRLTLEGERFFENCNLGVTHIIHAMTEMHDLRQGPPRGLIRVCSTTGFGRKVVAPLLTRFYEIYPEISVDLLLDDKPANFAGEQIDVAFCEGRIQDSSIIAKQLVPMQLLLCASRAYLEKRGLPRTIEELRQHESINLRLSNHRLSEWEFKVDGHTQKFMPTARLTFNDTELVLKAVIEGCGIAQIPAYQIQAHLSTNELVTVLTQHAPDDRGHYICYLCRQHLPSRIRVFVDFMTERIRALEPKNLTGSDPAGAGRFIEKLAA